MALTEKDVWHKILDLNVKSPSTAEYLQLVLEIDARAVAPDFAVLAEHFGGADLGDFRVTMPENGIFWVHFSQLVDTVRLCGNKVTPWPWTTDKMEYLGVLRRHPHGEHGIFQTECPWYAQVEEECTVVQLNRACLTLPSGWRLDLFLNDNLKLFQVRPSAQTIYAWLCAHRSGYINTRHHPYGGYNHRVITRVQCEKGEAAIKAHPRFSDPKYIAFPDGYTVAFLKSKTTHLDEYAIDAWVKTLVIDTGLYRKLGVTKQGDGFLSDYVIKNNFDGPFSGLGLSKNPAHVTAVMQIKVSYEPPYRYEYTVYDIDTRTRSAGIFSVWAKTQRGLRAVPSGVMDQLASRTFQGDEFDESLLPQGSGYVVTDKPNGGIVLRIALDVERQLRTRFEEAHVAATKRSACECVDTYSLMKPPTSVRHTGEHEFVYSGDTVTVKPATPKPGDIDGSRMFLESVDIPLLDAPPCNCLVHFVLPHNIDADVLDRCRTAAARVGATTVAAILTCTTATLYFSKN